MKSFLEFCVVPTLDAQGSAVYLHFDDQTYLIGNLCEGLSRACIQQNVSFKKIGRVLISGRAQWTNLGGAMGLLLNIATVKHAVQSEKGQPNVSEPDQRPSSKLLSFYGAPNLNYIFATARRFIFRTGTPISATEYPAGPSLSAKDLSEPTWRDERIKVWAISTLPENSKPSTRDSSEDVARCSEIVTSMFDSGWEKGRLVQVRLRDVKSGDIFLRDPETHETVPYTGPRPRLTGESPRVPDILVWQRQPWPATQTQTLPTAEPSEESISYLVKTHPLRGKFMPEKAKSLQIEDKKLYKTLATGHSVTNSKGETITPDMVLGPGRPGTGFAFIDIPTSEYISTTLAQPHWTNQDAMQDVTSFIWTLGPGLAEDSRIVDFQRRFPELHHIISAPDAAPEDFILDTSRRSVIRHNYVAPESYPKTVPDIRKQNLSSTPLGDLGGKPIPASRALQLHLSPDAYLDVNGSNLPTPVLESNIVDETNGVIGQEIEHFRQLGNSSEGDEWRNSFKYQDVEITTLGTGSAAPGLDRNVSSTLVRVPVDGSYLLDAGEGTLGSLRRMYNLDDLNTLFKDLRLVWISHLHADHHLGTTSVLRAWYEIVHQSRPMGPDENGPVLAVAGPLNMIRWLKEYSAVEDFGISRLQLIPVAASQSSPTNTTVQDDISYNNQAATELLKGHGIKELKTCWVPHCYGAQGVAITTNSNFKFAYSGDCRPNSPFAEIGKGADVLIHEATFEDDMRAEARAKRHSTAGEAVSVALAMEAKVCILTHFSQRYPKMPSLDYMTQAATGTPTAAVRDVNLNSNTAETELVDNDLDPFEMNEEAEQRELDANEMVERPEPPSARRTRQYSPPPGKDTVSQIYTEAIVGGKIKEMIERQGMRIVMAFDYMRLSMKNVPRLEQQQPILRLLYDRMAQNELGQKNARLKVLEAEKQEKILARKAKLEAKSEKRSKEDKQKEGKAAKKAKLSD